MGDIRFKRFSVIVLGIIRVYSYGEIDRRVCFGNLNGTRQCFWIGTGDNELLNPLFNGFGNDLIQIIVIAQIIQVAMGIYDHGLSFSCV